MKIVILSDTHGLHKSLVVPEGDVLIHCGDFCNSGELEDVIYFNTWLGQLKHKHKIVIAGNHDFFMEQERDTGKSLLTNATYLENSGVTIEGINFWGSPYCPKFMHWAFMYLPSQMYDKVWANVPINTDVLITHTPPKKILDELPFSSTGNNPFVGDSGLKKRIEELPNLLLHCFGHIHNSYGTLESVRTESRVPLVYVNASICDEDYNPVNKPIVVKI